MANRSLNKVMLIGNLTRDPELKYIPSGAAVCNFGLATNRRWNTSDGQVKEDVQFHRVVAWNKLAELVSKLLIKGSRVYIEGRIVYRTFAGKDGVQRTISEVVMDDFILLSGGQDRDKSSAERKVASGEKIPEVDINDVDVADVIGQESSDDKGSEKKEDKKGKKKEDDSDDIPF